MTKDGTKQLPMGPRYLQQCANDLRKQRKGEISVEAVIGYAWWWARERGVSGWSKARLANDEGHMMDDPDDIAHNMEEQKDG